MLLEVYLSVSIFPNLDDLLLERTDFKKRRKISLKEVSELTNYVTKLLRTE